MGLKKLLKTRSLYQLRLVTKKYQSTITPVGFNEQHIVCKSGECSKEFCVFESVPICPNRVKHDHHLRLFRFFINTSTCGEEQLFPCGTSDI